MSTYTYRHRSHTYWCFACKRQYDSLSSTYYCDNCLALCDDITLLHNLPEDYDDCLKCHCDIVYRQQLIQDLQYLYQCTNCKHYWTVSWDHHCMLGDEE